MKCCECIFDGKIIEYNKYAIDNKVMNGPPGNEIRRKKYIARGYAMDSDSINSKPVIIKSDHAD